MCELLVHRAGRGDPLSATDYQPFDVVAIREDGEAWGSREKGPGTSFFVFELPNIPKADAIHLKEPEHVDIGTAEEPNPQMTRRRKWNVIYDDMPVAVQDVVTRMGGGVMLFDGWRLRLTGPDRQQFLDAMALKQ